ncbi:MAG: hypothetical protein LBF42_01010 [Puniceicoccales bacterium]|nr:hypothetical protein [Puniceicoccales bacterium]
MDEAKNRAAIHLKDQLTRPGFNPRSRLFEFCQTVRGFGAKNTEILSKLLPLEIGPNGETLQKILNGALRDGSDLLRQDLDFNGHWLSAR